MKTIWFVFLLAPFFISAQINISGVVAEAESGEPVLYATVYEDGTLNGTITNAEGQFVLENIHPPCKIVISHISYETVVIAFEEGSDTMLHIRLTPKDVKVGEVEITDKNRREENLEHFKERFLGTDYWGRHARIINDSVLVFKKVKNDSLATAAGKLAPDRYSQQFIVETKGPLYVELPLLGYQLHIDLIEFVELQTDKEWLYEIHALGYYYFQLTENASKRKTNRYRKKRLQAYYNSDRHFCRSLYQNTLKENGYFVYHVRTDPKTRERENIEFDFDTCTTYADKLARVTGLEERSFNVGYYEMHNKPFSIKDGREGRPSSYSYVHFLNDTCIIREDGSRPDNSIMFGPVIGNKRVGAMLPHEFRTD